MEISGSLEKILGMALEGHSSSDIAKALSLTEGAVRIYQTTLNNLARYAYSGRRNFKKTSEELGISKKMFNNLLTYKEGIKAKRQGKAEIEERAKRIVQYAQEDLTLREIAKRERINYSYISRLLKKEGIKTKRQGKAEIEKREARIVQYAQQDLTPSLEQIAQAVGLTGEAVRSHLIRSGEHETWKANRQNQQKIRKQEAEQKKRILSEIINSTIAEKVQQSENPLAAQLTLNYLENHKSRDYSYSFEQLYKLFSRYHESKEKGKKLSLEELGKNSGISYAGSVGKILKSVGLEPMTGARERHITPEWKKQAIKKMARQVSTKDIAYFLSLPYNIVFQNLTIWGLKKSAVSEIVRFGHQKISLRHASQVYEAKNTGFSDAETAEVLEIPEKAVDYCIKNKKPISQRIVNALKILYPSRKSDKPYLTTIERRK